MGQSGEVDGSQNGPGQAHDAGEGVRGSHLSHPTEQLRAVIEVHRRQHESQRAGQTPGPAAGNRMTAGEVTG